MKKILGILGLLIVLWSVLAIFASDTFLKPNNIENLLQRTAMYGLLGIGVAFAIIHSGIDLSIGSVVCLSAALLAIFLKVDYPPHEALSVIEIRSANQLVLSTEEGDAPKDGDKIWFGRGGPDARNLLLTVKSSRNDGSATLVTLDKSLDVGREPKAGFPTIAVLEFTPGDLSNRNAPVHPTVTLKGKHTYLRPRDRLKLLTGQKGPGDFPILSTTILGDTTVVQLSDIISGFSLDWVAVPHMRKQRMPVVVALSSVLAIALALGLAHGLLVTKVKLPPFVVTLCGLLIYRGISRWLVGDQPVGFGVEYGESLSPIALGKLNLWTQIDETGQVVNSFGIPIPFFVFFAVAVVAAVFLNKTIWGRYLLALGRNEEAARYSGINTDRIVILAYMICTALAAVGGMLFGLNSNSVSPSAFGSFFELYAIAAAVLGGCSLRGGEGSILGVIIGTAVMQTLNNMIVLLHIDGSLEFAIIGMVILIGVIADEMFKRLAARRRALASARGAGLAP